MNTSPPLERPASWSPPASCAPVLADDYSGKAPAPLLNHLSDVHWGPLNDRREDQVAPGLKVLQFIHLERNLNNALDTVSAPVWERNCKIRGPRPHLPGPGCQPQELPGWGAELEEELEDLSDVSRQGRRTEHSTPRDGDGKVWRVTSNKQYVPRLIKPQLLGRGKGDIQRKRGRGATQGLLLTEHEPLIHMDSLN